MNKADPYDLCPEYRRGDLDSGVRGKYLESYRSGTNLVLRPLAQRPKEIFAVTKMIIFDYGRTLYDRETDDFFPDAIPVVKTLAEKYRLSIVSVSPADEEEARIEALREKGILDHFEEIVFTASGDAKSKEYEALLRKVDLKANEVVVVDDYIIRGIAWGNAAGATTVWFQNGKFADLVPNDETGDPDFTIHSLSELLKILDQACHFQRGQCV